LIAVIIFYLHTIFACYAFSKTYQSEGLLQAFLNVIFIIILFSVGWTVSALIVGLFIPDSGYVIAMPDGKFFLSLIKLTGFYTPAGFGMARLAPKDSLSLIVLTIIEIYFYKFYFQNTKVVKTY